MDFGSNTSDVPSNQVIKLREILLREEENKRHHFLQSLSERNQDLSTTINNIPTSSTLRPLSNSQSSIEHQLQQQVDFYQEALVNLQERSTQIAEENAKLYDKMRESILNEQHLTSDDDDNDVDGDGSDVEFLMPSFKEKTMTLKKERLMKTKTELQAEKEKNNQETNLGMEDLNLIGVEMDKLKELQAAKTKHLESLLHAARKQVDEKERVITELKSEMNYYKMPVKEDPNSVVNFHVSKSLPNSIPGTKLVQRLTRECQDLSDSLEKQRKMVAAGNQREVEAYEQVKKSCELVEQIQLEKQEALVQVMQLKKDLSQYKDKYLDVQKKLKEHQLSYNARQKNNLIVAVDKLNRQVEEQAMTIAGLQNELEKTTRTKVDLKRELEQHQLKMLTQETETTAMIDETRRETLDALKGKTLLEEEMNQIRFDHRIREKKKHQEIDQLTGELNEAKRRLQSTEETVTSLQNQVIHLTDQNNSTDQKFHREQIQRQLDQQAYEEQKRKMVLGNGKREQELLQMLQQSEQGSASNQQELTRLMESQGEILCRFKEECMALKGRLQSEQQMNGDKMAKLQEKCQHLLQTIQDLKRSNSEKDEQIAESLEHLKMMQNDCVDYKEQVIALLNKQNMILRDRNLLTKEIELLKSQMKVPSSHHMS